MQRPELGIYFQGWFEGPRGSAVLPGAQKRPAILQAHWAGDGIEFAGARGLSDRFVMTALERKHLRVQRRGPRIVRTERDSQFKFTFRGGAVPIVSAEPNRQCRMRSAQLRVEFHGFPRRFLSLRKN